MALVSARPQPYLSRHNPLLHSGVVAVTGQLTVDLGLGHNNFVPSLTINGGLANLASGHLLAWAYGSKPGTFVITVAKRPAAFGDWILATVAVNVSFTVIAGASAE